MAKLKQNSMLSNCYIDLMHRFLWVQSLLQIDAARWNLNSTKSGRYWELQRNLEKLGAQILSFATESGLETCLVFNSDGLKPC